MLMFKYCNAEKKKMQFNKKMFPEKHFYIAANFDTNLNLIEYVIRELILKCKRLNCNRYIELELDFCNL